MSSDRESGAVEVEPRGSAVVLSHPRVCWGRFQSQCWFWRIHMVLHCQLQIQSGTRDRSRAWSIVQLYYCSHSTTVRVRSFALTRYMRRVCMSTINRVSLIQLFGPQIECRICTICRGRACKVEVWSGRTYTRLHSMTLQRRCKSRWWNARIVPLPGCFRPSVAFSAIFGPPSCSVPGFGASVTAIAREINLYASWTT